MTTAKEIVIPNSAVSPPQPPPQKKQKTPKMLPEIPEDIIFYEILPRIPAKNLMTFKLVSHQWNSFISYPNTRFANTHLHLSLSSSPTRNSRSVLTIPNTPFFESVDYEKEVVGSSLEITKYGTNLLNRDPLWLLSSCNGLGFLICVHDQRLKCECEVGHKYEHNCECKCSYFEVKLPDELHEFEFRYLICNPVLGIDSFVEIDHPHDQIFLGSSSDNAVNGCYNFGFGHVSSLDDYYIVVITLPRGVARSEVVVYVYSLRSLRWGTPRKFKQNRLPLVFQNTWYNEIGTLVNETLHWGVSVGDNQKCIAAFDLAANQDEFKFMPLPYPDFGNARRRPVDPCFCLCCMDGCLCAWANYDEDDGRIDIVEMWMMKQYGVNESWTKLFRCDLGHYPRNIFGLTKAGMVLILVPRNTKLRLIDVSCDPPRDTGIVLKDIWQAANYVQSLVSPLAIMSEQQE